MEGNIGVSMSLRLLLSALVALPVAAYAAEPAPTILTIRSKPPIVSFDVYVHGSDGTLILPEPPQFTLSRKNADGLDVLPRDGVDHFHVGNISAQAAAMSNADIDMGPVFARPPGLSQAQKIALNWLETNKIEIPHEAVVWHYTFSHPFNAFVVKGGWPSSFGQADVIKALLVARQSSNDSKYIELAKRAAYAFTVPCEKGGLRCEVGGVPWFEEVPVPYGYAPMILNGHLYATVMLGRLWKETGDARIKEAFDEGMASAKKMLLRFDTGYWSTYQNRPRTMNLPLTLQATDPQTELREVTTSSPFTSDSSIVFGKHGGRTYPGNVATGIGELTDTGGLITGQAGVQLTPGRMAVDNDSVNFPGFDITLRYIAKNCAPIRIGTIDWRSPSSGIMEVPGVKVEVKGGECVARGLLTTNINQWTTLNAFYHDWHTRLVTELWRMSGDSVFYTTAVRWRGYEAVFKADQAKAAPTTFLKPVFAVKDSSEDDRTVMAALGGADPAQLVPDAAAEMLRTWAAAKGLSVEKTSELLTRIGHPAP